MHYAILDEAVAQRELLAEVGDRFRVRMALHTGEAQLRDEGNYFGQTVIRCARLRALGHGGQVLVSRTAADLSVDALPGGADLLDRFPDGVWWTELAPLASGDEVAAAVARACGVAEVAGASVADAIAARLVDRAR